MNGSGELDRPRDLGELLRDSFVTLGRRPLSFLAIGVVFAVPIELVVSGVGLEQLTSPYEKKIQPVEAAIGALSSYVLTTPLITVAVALMIAGAAPSAGRAAIRTVESSTPLILAAILGAIGVGVGLFFLIIPGLYLLVRWYFFPQAVALEDRRGIDPLRRSSELTDGHWLRAAGVLLLANLIALLPGGFVTVPFASLARSTGREWPVLAGEILGQIVTAPIVAVIATLLFFDLRARRAQPFA